MAGDPAALHRTIARKLAMRTTNTWRTRAKAETADAAIDRRAKQIFANNPAHPWTTARRAAEEEQEATRLARAARETGKPEAMLHLRTRQLQAANLDLDYEAAQNLARLQLAGDA